MSAPPSASIHRPGVLSAFLRFVQHESTGGILLVLAAIAALALSNSPWSGWYERFLQLPGEVRLGDFRLAKPLILWVNDFWMAIFFFLVGLEIKREMLEGELSSLAQAILPIVAAIGGMAAPAAIYAVVNAADPIALRGWAIPAATDIAFALGILVLLGSRIPVSLKIFLTAVAIIDDLGAIMIIALFYTSDLSVPMLLAAALGVLLLILMNRRGITAVGPYVFVGLVIWVCVLKSGVHATLAGVITALAIPLSDQRGGSPLRLAEHALHPWVAYVILPLFAFANAGVSLVGVAPATMFEPLPMGIALGLFAGKTIGVFGAAGLLIALGLAVRPAGASWAQFLGVCILCGIGFTMSLFIGSLAFDSLDPSYATRLKLGVLSGSVLSATVGFILLRMLPRQS
jgi:NhaA family Na+:H+ antiporter